ncbi:c-type cytochrome [Desulforhabdus amnigena]|jgi:hypothetical protein|uniref:Cytochrome c domain-containing protein n=1 Tax=Desulforhabdus amnigena TaxID=40218 RepID=A0A9W6FWS0_9BACT|nr:c-type cytochrome [Desulforhabdus amnigena]NLJ29885.1 c-type cytochrome [Deltaproteobacteria bacterium]GLI36242.1 hypothetical protein DAMNIGENAA_36750 [Desulforhabdus amnigena]
MIACPSRLIYYIPVVMMAFSLLCGCDYARMKEQEALRTYKTVIPEMPEGTIPTRGGIEIARKSDPKTLQNPLILSQESVARGKTGYETYCLMCHGPNADGNGTVGQSFHPLPTDLRDPKVQAQTDGEIFYKLSFGAKRQPPLAYTIAEEDRWAIVHFIRSLKSPSNG